MTSVKAENLDKLFPCSSDFKLFFVQCSVPPAVYGHTTLKNTGSRPITEVKQRRVRLVL